MCGIAGIVSLDGFDPAVLVAATQMIDYRGPNGFGFAYVAASPGTNFDVRHADTTPPAFPPVVGLGNRRLAILDLSANGSQPMLSEDGALCLTYNGEIYNYREIRAELEQLGHRFRTHTDTEVLLRSFRQWGEHCLHRFNGMWSFAIWDNSSRKLFCSRDRLGVKPFYFVSTPHAFYFGSEIKQVLSASGTPRAANPEILADFLEWGLQDHSSQTSFLGVSQLLGGQSLTLTLDAPLQPRINTWWHLNAEPQRDASPEDAVNEFRSTFSSAVRLRLRSDVPVGVSLSGGLDSSAILCEASRQSPSTSFNAFSACFENPEIDERNYISAILSATNAGKHWSFPDGRAFWQSVENIAYHQDEPIGGTSVFAQWSVMRSARQARVPVLLGGQGGDESLCGYRKYYFFHLWHLLRTANPRVFREAFQLASSGTSSHWSLGTISRYLPSAARNNWSPLRRLAAPALASAADRSATRRALGSARDVSERQKIDLQITSLPKLLRHEDRNSMAHSIETRMPFLDYRLVELAVRFPASLKLRDGWSKWILREAMAGTLPDEVRLRKSKLGFNAPESDWLRSGLGNGHKSLWAAGDARLANLLDPRRLETETQLFLSGSRASLPPEALFRALSLRLWAQVHQVN
jgi:asparagine synthase (glutamine-hydrolysing)